MSARDDIPADVSKLAREASIAYGTSRTFVPMETAIARAILADRSSRPAQHEADRDRAAEDERIREDEEGGLLNWMARDASLSLQWGSIDRSDECAPYRWLVHQERGGINDREWDLVGYGETPIAAMTAARAALRSSPHKGGTE